MNSLIFGNGGMRLEGDDLKFQFDAFREGIEAVLKSFLDSDGNAVLWGCAVIDGSPNITSVEGYVMLGGELRYMPAQVIAKGVNTFSEFHIVEDNRLDDTGDNVLIDGGTLKMWEVRRAKIMHDANPSQPYISCQDVEDKRIEQLIFKRIEKAGTSFQSSWSAKSGTPLSCNVVGNRLVSISGMIIGNTSGAGFVHAVSIPQAYAPLVQKEFICRVSGDNTTFAIVQVRTDGTIYVNAQDTAYTPIAGIDLSAVSYVI